MLIFLLLPLLIFGLGLWNRDFIEHVRDYKFLSPFYQSITALTFGLSGLRSIDRYVETRNGKSDGSRPAQ